MPDEPSARIVNQEMIEAVCRAAGVELPPSQRHRIRTYKPTGGKSHPCDRKPRRAPSRAYVGIVADVPQHSGIYFFWRDNVPFYVGQAIDLQQRLASHPMKKYCDEVAWLFCPRENLNFREALYIGIIEPIANFGTIEQVRVDSEETYHHEERIGELVVRRSADNWRPVELPPPPGSILRFPGI